jgi:iron(III) transport system ATP-binding protein
MTGVARSPVLAIEALEVRYGRVGAVKGTDLAIDGPGITALVGPSGCGKTTLLRAVAGFERPAGGRVRIAGVTVAGEGSWVPPEARRVGMVFQDGALFPHLSVLQNVRYGLAGERRAAARVDDVLVRVGIAELADRYPDQLSGGQRQRVALARALAPAPRMILLDEPFANLDATLRARVREEMRQILEANGVCALLVTHDQEEALSFADRVAVMIDGRILQTGTPEEIYHRPISAQVAEFIGDGHLVECAVTAGRFSSDFGSATCEAADGPGVLFLRPEDLRLVRRSLGDGVPGTVVERRFFGHDVLDCVQLVSGAQVEVRSLSSATVPVGSPVRLTLKERTYRVFRETD